MWLVIAAVVWLVTIWQWQTTGAQASTSDIVWRLLVLPLALALALLAALWGVQRLRAPAPAPAPAASPTATTSAAPSPPLPGSEEALRQATVWVLGAAANLCLGAQADQAWSALQAVPTRPDLDPDLQDLDGLPVFSARVNALDTAEWLAQASGLAHPDGRVLPDAVARAVGLLASVLPPLLDSVSALTLGTDAPASDTHMAARGDASPSYLSGVAVPVNTAVARAREARAPSLTVRLLMPPQWHPQDQERAVQWVKQQCGPLLDWAQASGARALRWLVNPVATPEAVWDELDQAFVQWHRDPRPDLLLLLALDSALDATHIDHLQAVGSLFTAQHQTGRVPGEGAAGVLLASPGWPRDGAHDERLATPPLRLWRPVRGRREHSADAAGRVGSAALQALLTQALALSAAPVEALQVLADADHRASRTAELYEGLQAVAPGLDPLRQVARLGEACGELGMARALAPLALACAALHQTNDAQTVALVTLLQSPHERVALALAPSQPAPPHAV